MISAVLDTNVLVRALLTPKSSDGLIFQLFLEGKIEIFFSQILLSEISRVLYYPRLKNKYHLSEEDIAIFLQTIITFGKLTHPTKKTDICRDPDDNEIISIALSVYEKQKIYVVTGDEDLLVLAGKLKELNIVTASRFLKDFQ